MFVTTTYYSFEQYTNKYSSGWGDSDFPVANWTRGLSYMADHVGFSRVDLVCIRANKS